MAPFRNPVLTDDEGIDRGDPFVLRYLDRYYLYHTSENRGPGILVYSSSDLLNWEPHGYAIHPSDEADHWAQSDLWAPEVMYEDGTFYMYVTGTRFDEHGEPSDEHRRQGLARSTDPRGPFTLDPRPLIDDEWTIDGHPLRDQDGITWLVYNTRERIWDPVTETSYLARQTGNVIDQLVAPDKLAGYPSIVSFPTEAWEGNGHFYWNEGAWVLKRGGRYHLLYSGCDYRDRGYAVGLLTASNPRGPWIKHPENPILRSGNRIIGPGHPSVALAPDNVTPYIVYHAYVDDPAQGRKVHIDRVQWAGEMPVIGQPAGVPTEAAQRRPPQPVYDEAVPTWVADFWARGEWVDVAGVRIELPGNEMHRVRVQDGVEGFKVWTDDRLAHEEPPRGTGFAIDSEAEVMALGVTSCVDDEREHVLVAGENRIWEWGGDGAVEVTMAICGSCVVNVGTAQVQVDQAQDRFGLFKMVGRARTGIAVRAIADGARVADLLVVAREEEYLDDRPGAVEPGAAHAISG